MGEDEESCNAARDRRFQHPPLGYSDGRALARDPDRALAIELTPVKEEGEATSNPTPASSPTPTPTPTAAPTPTAPKKKAAVQIELKKIDQPLYREVDAMNGLIATARIATPATITNFYDEFQKEPDGYDFTVLQGPAPLKLWENTRKLVLLEVSDLPDLKLRPGDRLSYRPLAIWSEVPYARQVIVFQDEDAEGKFLAALDGGTLGMVKRTDRRGGTWYRFVSCGSKEDREKASAETSKVRDRPGPGEVWLGVERNDEIKGTEGLVVGFSDNLGLEDIHHYQCCRKGVKPCS